MPKSNTRKKKAHLCGRFDSTFDSRLAHHLPRWRHTRARPSTIRSGFRFGQKIVERRAIEIAAVGHHRLNTLCVGDALQWIRIQQDKISEPTGRHGSD